MNDADSPQTGFTLITGASGGIGQAICRRLAADGDQLVLLYGSRRPHDLIDDLGSHVVDSAGVQLQDPSGVVRVVERVMATQSEMKAVIHAAGPHIPMIHLSRVDPQQMATQLEQDVLGFFNLMQAVLPSLRQSRGSMTVVTTAATSRYPVRDGLSAGPKAAVEGLARGFASEEGRFGVRVNCVGPGMLTDGMAARLIESGDLDDLALEVAKRSIALRTFGTAQDIAEAVAFLASSKAKFITGQKLNVDGGYAI